MYIGDLLNKIRWDPKENPKDYLIVYYDGVANKNFEIPFNEVSREGMFLILRRNNQEISIPLHRVKQLKKKDKIIWQR